MIDQKDLNITIEINGKPKVLQLLVTLGFWKKCGFKKDEAQCIETDPEKYSKALLLALYYGNKKDFGWNSIEDMGKIITEDMIDELDQSYTQTLSFAMVHYLPEKLRKIVLAKLNSAEDDMAKVVDAAMESPEDLKKK